MIASYLTGRCEVENLSKEQIDYAKYLFEKIAEETDLYCEEEKEEVFSQEVKEIVDPTEYGNSLTDDMIEFSDNGFVITLTEYVYGERTMDNFLLHLVETFDLPPIYYSTATSYRDVGSGEAVFISKENGIEWISTRQWLHDKTEAYEKQHSK